MAKRKSKKQKLAAQKQSERMKKYWAMKHAENEETAEQVGDYMDKMKLIPPILHKVYMAGWKQMKGEEINPIDGAMSVSQAYKEISEIFKP